ncbi:MAG: O-methyltransferase [Candidatus Roizmanbacteria bacterium]
MMISPEQGEHMRFLVKQSKAKLGIEIGTFTGYSSLCLAEGLGDDGKLITCDIDRQASLIA